MKKLHLLYFSPTGSTKKVVEGIGAGFGGKAVGLDFTSIHTKEQRFTADDVVILGIPVYYGRVQHYAVEHLKRFTAENTPCAVVAVYGMRAYDDALLELRDVCTTQGFRVIAGAAFAAQHSFSAEIGTGRPNADDLAAAFKLGEQLAKKVADGDLSQPPIPGNFPYIERPIGGVTPVCSESCTLCSACVSACPFEAIPADQPRTTDASKCINCGRCISYCPTSARHFAPALMERVENYLKPKCQGENLPSVFI